MIITGQQFHKELQEIGAVEIKTYRDSNYFCPSKAWLDEFGEFLAGYFPPPKKQGNDCDDYAIGTVYQATLSLIRSGINGCGHSFGYAELMLHASVNGIEPGPHATNIVRLDDSTIYLYEPQNRQFEKAAPVLLDGRADLHFAWV